MNFEGISQERLVRFTCDCVLVNIELIKPYTDEYDEIVEWLNNPIAATAAVIYTASVGAAAGVVRGAAYAAADVVRGAAYAAAADADYTDYAVINSVVRDVVRGVVRGAKRAGNPERIDALYEELLES